MLILLPLNYPIIKRNVTSSVITAGSDTPSDQALVTAIQEAHSIGLKVQISIYPNSNDTTWRAYINPDKSSIMVCKLWSDFRSLCNYCSAK